MDISLRGMMAMHTIRSNYRLAGLGLGEDEPHVTQCRTVVPRERVPIGAMVTMGPGGRRGAYPLHCLEKLQIPRPPSHHARNAQLGALSVNSAVGLISSGTA